MECIQSRKIKMSKSEYSGVERRQKHTESKKWKRARNIALQTQSRRENEFIEDTLLPERHISARNQRYATWVRWQSLLHKLSRYGVI